MKTLPQAILPALLLAGTPAAHAAITDVSVSGSNVTSVTVDGSTYAASSLIRGTVTGISDSNAVQILVGEGAPAPTVGNRAATVSDLDLTTGILNLATLSFTFDQPIVNHPGINILLFDWGAYSGDTFGVTINGVTFTGLSNSDGSLPAGGDYFPFGPGQRGTYYTSNSSSGISTVAELEALSFGSSGTASPGSPDASVGQAVIGLDLSAFNVAPGDSITTIDLAANGVTDFTVIVGVPEPGVPILAGLGALLLAIRRRRA